MLRKKLNRIQIHKKICERVGMTTKSHIGYLSRSEMLDVLLFVDKLLNDLDQRAKASTIYTDGQGNHAKIARN
jgi:hypothetical protein